MILVGIAGTMLTSGPSVLLSQLHDLAFSQYSCYDLSVLPMSILMGWGLRPGRDCRAIFSVPATRCPGGSRAASRWP